MNEKKDWFHQPACGKNVGEKLSSSSRNELPQIPTIGFLMFIGAASSESPDQSPQYLILSSAVGTYETTRQTTLSNATIAILTRNSLSSGKIKRHQTKSKGILLAF